MYCHVARSLPASHSPIPERDCGCMFRIVLPCWRFLIFLRRSACIPGGSCVMRELSLNLSRLHEILACFQHYSGSSQMTRIPFHIHVSDSCRCLAFVLLPIGTFRRKTLHVPQLAESMPTGSLLPTTSQSCSLVICLGFTAT